MARKNIRNFCIIAHKIKPDGDKAQSGAGDPGL